MFTSTPKKTIKLKSKLFKPIMYVLKAFMPPDLTAKVTARLLIRISNHQKPSSRNTFQKQKRKPDSPTITVLFVEQTPGGELAKKSQKV